MRVSARQCGLCTLSHTKHTETHHFAVLGIDALEVSRHLEDALAQVDEQLRLADVLGLARVGVLRVAPQQHGHQGARPLQLPLVQLLWKHKVVIGLKRWLKHLGQDK